MRHYLTASAAVGLVASACALFGADLYPGVHHPESGELLPVPPYARALLFASLVLSPPYFAAVTWAPTSWLLEHESSLRLAWVGATVGLYLCAGAWLYRERSSPVAIRFGAPMGAWAFVAIAFWGRAFWVL